MKVIGDLLPHRLRCKLAHGVLREDVAHDRRGLDHGALFQAQLVDAGCEQSLDRRGDRHDRQIAGRVPPTVHELQPLFLDQHREQLLDEEGVALGGVDHAHSNVVVEPGVAEQVLDHALAVIRAERLEHDVRLVWRARPFRPDLDQVRARVAENEHGCVLDRLPDVLDEIEERRLRPVEILEYDDERPRARE